MIAIADLDDYQLLRRFVEEGCEDAFNQLVNSHIDSVYSVSLRETNDPVLAQDVTQAVFLTLLQKASTIGSKTVLSGWLFNTTRFAAKNAMRQERRRKDVEQEIIEEVSQSTGHVDTWQAIEPVLHEAIAALGTKDRDAILLRFFEDKSLKEVGVALHITEHAAQMRVLRAVEKMKQHLRKKGIVVPVAILSTVLSQHAVQAAPAVCVQAVGHLLSVLGASSATAVSAGLATVKAHTISQGVIKGMFIKKLKVASLVTTACATGAVGTVAISPWGTTTQAMAQAPKPPRLVWGPSTVVTTPPVLPIELVAVNVGAKTVTIREPKAITTERLVNGARYKIVPGPKLTVAVTPKTQLNRIESRVPIAQINVGDTVSGGSSRKFQIPVEGTPPRGLPATSTGAYAYSRFAGKFKVVSVNPLRLQKADIAQGKAADEVIDVPKEVEAFSRSATIELSELSELAQAKAMGIPINIETAKTAAGKLEITKITILGPKPRKMVLGSDFTMGKDPKTGLTTFQIGSSF